MQRILGVVRLALILISAFLLACSPAPGPSNATSDPTAEPWYRNTVSELTAMNSRASDLIDKGQPDDASALIQQGESLSTRLLAVPHPTLAAMQAASDLDRLYGSMLLSNRNYGWARLFFQKNLARWRHWQPQTEDTDRRLKEAQSSIAECDRHIAQ